MEPLTQEQIESACEILDRRREASAGGICDLARLAEGLVAELQGRISCDALLTAYKTWKRTERMSREFGENEDERGAEMDEFISERADGSGSVVSLVIGRLIGFMGEERLFQQRFVRRRSERRLRQGEMARGIEGPGQLVVAGRAISWLACATVIEAASGIVAALPECRFERMLQCRPAVQFHRFTLAASESAAKRLMSKWAAIGALFSDSKSAAAFAEHIGITRANLSHHARRFAAQRLASDSRTRLNGVRMASGRV